MAQRKGKDQFTYPVGVRFDAELFGKLEEAARRDHNPVSVFVRAAVAEKLRRLEREAALGVGSTL